MPDAVFAALLASGAVGVVVLSSDWVASLVDLALWELPIQFGVSIAIGCALSVRALERPWLVLVSALLGWAWSVGSFYWRELSAAAPEHGWHLLSATSAVFIARWGVAWRLVPDGAGLDRASFATVFAPLLQSALFYGALLVSLIFVAAIVPIIFDVDIRMTDSAPRLSILATAYGVRAITCLPPIARRIRDRLGSAPPADRPGPQSCTGDEAP